MFDDGQCVYLVQDLLRGEELLDRLLRMPNFTERDASDIICTLTKTVEYLHSQGVRRSDHSSRNMKGPFTPLTSLTIFQVRFTDITEIPEISGGSKIEAMTQDVRTDGKAPQY